MYMDDVKGKGILQHLQIVKIDSLLGILDSFFLLSPLFLLLCNFQCWSIILI